MRILWHSYGGSRQTGVRAFAELPDAIALQFIDGGVYVYDAESPGRLHVEAMLRLARAGKGLTTYVNRFVRQHYSGQLNLTRPV